MKFYYSYCAPLKWCTVTKIPLVNMPKLFNTTCRIIFQLTMLGQNSDGIRGHARVHKTIVDCCQYMLLSSQAVLTVSTVHIRIIIHENHDRISKLLGPYKENKTTTIKANIYNPHILSRLFFVSSPCLFFFLIFLKKSNNKFLVPPKSSKQSFQNKTNEQS